MRLFVFATALLLQTLPAQDRPHHIVMQMPVQRWVDDLHSKKLEDILSLYAPDAVFIEPDGHTYSTPAELRKLYQRTFSTFDSDLTFGGTGFSLGGPPSAPRSIAGQISDYSENLRTRATGATKKYCGRCMFTWKQQADGRWLITRQQWTVSPCSAYKL